jgi:3-dehydrotetronate 4-kinase
MNLLLGCIADDFTGATDLANNLVRSGMRVVQTIGVPTGPLSTHISEPVDAVVVALKSRTIAPQEAIAQSLAALHWLQAQGAGQFYFKVCSTFDSTPQGNIGPVTEALMDALGTDFAVVTPAFPDNGRTVFKGHLFVGDMLLSDSGMRDHPLTPMLDSSLVRVMQAQSARMVGLIDHAVVAAGEGAIRARITQLRSHGVGLAIADAVSNADLFHLGEALNTAKLMTAGSGLAIGLAHNFGIKPSAAASKLPAAQGSKAIVSGSCSQATNRQVQAFKQAGHAALAIGPLRIAAGIDVAAEALSWAEAQLATSPDEPLLIYSSADTAAVQAVQGQLGVGEAGAMVEQTLGRIARGLVDRGVRQLVVAGGETSGACVQALGVALLRIGPQIDTGVPWCHATVKTGSANAGLHLALKSGNFGTDDFFTKAFKSLSPAHHE